MSGAGQPPRSLDDDGYLLAPYITYQPTPYDAGITGDPELRWDQVQPEPEPEAEASL